MTPRRQAIPTSVLTGNVACHTNQGLTVEGTTLVRKSVAKRDDVSADQPSLRAGRSPRPTGGAGRSGGGEGEKKVEAPSSARPEFPRYPQPLGGSDAAGSAGRVHGGVRGGFGGGSGDGRGGADATPTLIVRVPIRTVSALNVREHWSVRARRVKAERWATGMLLNPLPVPQLPCDVALIRLGPGKRLLDDDNLRGALKGVRDEVARWLGVDDGSCLVRWHYAQERSHEWAVTVMVRDVGAW